MSAFVLEDGVVSHLFHLRASNWTASDLVPGGSMHCPRAPNGQLLVVVTADEYDEAVVSKRTMQQEARGFANQRDQQRCSQDFDACSRDDRKLLIHAAARRSMRRILSSAEALLPEFSADFARTIPLAR